MVSFTSLAAFSVLHFGSQVIESSKIIQNPYFFGLAGSLGVRGSIPLSSTKNSKG